MAHLSPCMLPKINFKKSWSYQECYVGERNYEQQKNGDGTYYWSGAESLEWYTGRLLRDTMHGIGEYRCRHRDEPNVQFTYEGHFYNNYIHGYGVKSYPNGNVFTGIYHSNLRWGPGVETDIHFCANVGLWKGNKLVRLTWKPSTYSVIPDLMSTQIGRDVVAQKRTLLVVKREIIGQINPALELLKKYGADPMTAAQKWSKLYPKNCTDEKSKLFYADGFNRAYYDNNEIVSLEDYTYGKHENQDLRENSSSLMNEKSSDPDIFYAWNNNKMIIHMMKHCYKHEAQRRPVGLNLNAILSGPRSLFKPAADHELNCRALLLSSYLGHIQYVAQLINEYDVNPNVTDMQGNSAIMYAACGNQPAIIHFLVEAGAQINDYNDACCTPLGVVLINYVCTQLSILPLEIINTILPLTVDKVNMKDRIFEWQIERDWTKRSSTTIPETSGSRTIKSAHETPSNKSDLTVLKKSKLKITSNTTITEDHQNELYIKLNKEFAMTVKDLFKESNSSNQKYFFEVNDMVEEINAYYKEEQTKGIDNNDQKILIPKLKLQKLDRNQSSKSQTETSLKDEQLLKSMMSTITQLLFDGADPRMVCCPQPALFFAVLSQNVDLIRTLVENGAELNEVYPDIQGYTPLDIAISRTLTNANLEVIRTLLELGAKGNHRLLVVAQDNATSVTDEGPTLLHAVLAKENKREADEQIRQLLKLLLAHGCDPLAQYKGFSALHMALTASLDIFDLFIKSPNTNLNGVINNSDQSILMKIFQMSYCKSISMAERREMLSNLLLFGADPLIKCKNEEKEYDNIFAYAKGILTEQEKHLAPHRDENKLKIDITKNKNKSVNNLKSMNKGVTYQDIVSYKQALDQVMDCARDLFIRWIQANLMKDLITVVQRFKHRHWNMILKEYKNGTPLRLWLNPVRCLKIWDILQTTKERIYNDKRVKKYVLCIAVFHFRNKKTKLRWAVSSADRASIELEVAHFVREHSLVSEIEKFNICFECALPLKEVNVRCFKCKLVSFCSLECLEINVDRDNCHPCSAYLKKKYFSSRKDSEVKLVE